MEGQFTARWGAAIIICVASLYLYRRLRWIRDDSRAVIHQLTLNALLTLIPATLEMFDLAGSRYPWWLHSTANVSFLLNALAGYFIVDGLLHDRPFEPLDMLVPAWSWLFLALTGLMVTYQFQDRHYNIGNLLLREPQHKTIFYLLSNVLYVVLPAVLGLLIMRLYWRDLRRRGNLIYNFRRGCCIVAFCIGLTSVGIMLTHLALLYVRGGSYRYLIGWVDTCRMWFFIFLVPGYVLPEAFLARLLRPIERYLQRRKARQRQVLLYLHQRLTAIVPKVRLDPTPYDVRLMIEINDARDIIWSNLPAGAISRPQEEALQLHQLLSRRASFDRAGEQPAFPPDQGSLAYTLAVAEHLQRLEMSS